MNSKPRDTGGEFSGTATTVIWVAAKGPITVAKARPAASNDREQTANSGFVTSVPRDRVHTPCSTAEHAFWPQHLT